jgi:hypothetical protein
MTRREALLALTCMFALLATGLTWLFGPYGLIGCALLGGAAVLLGFERVEPRGEAVSDAVPDPLGAFERDFSL